MSRAPKLARAMAAATALCVLASGCMVGPNYQRPDAAVPVRYKASEGWVDAQPADDLDRGAWWMRFNDPVLAGLLDRVEISNQNVAAAAAAYDQARALVREQTASLFPSLTLDANVARSGSGSGDNRQSSSSYRLAVGAGWEPDLWGRIRRGIDSASASAQASQADLAAARLSAQGELAANYFSLRGTDAQIALLDETIVAYRRSLQIAQNRYDIGVIAKTDVLQAQTQLANTEADRVGLRRQRAQFENAIAVLSGQSPSEFTLPVTEWKPFVPAVPLDLPSTLLQRRPDIAAAERRVASANEQIGVAQAAFFPSFNLAGSLGFGATSLANFFSASGLAWSLGVSAAQVLFNAGATQARVEGAQAAHEQAVARYRQTVLAAFQEIENVLTATRVLEQQEALRRTAATAADQAAATVLNRYNAGQVGYTEVVIAQAAALSARRALVQLLADRENTAVALVQALGGGWHAPE